MKKILIVEDDAIVANIYRNKLQNEGFDVDVASDGQSAIAQVKKAPPDLVLLDLGLPKVNGVEVLKAIRAHPPTSALPVVVLSNSYVTAMVQAAWKAGANKCLSKASTTPLVLAEVVQRLFAAPAAATLVPLAPGVAVAPAAPNFESPPARSSGGSEFSTPASVSSDALFQSHVRMALLSSAPGFMDDLRKRLKVLALGGELQSSADLFDFYSAVHALTGHAGTAGFTAIANLCAALEALLKELHEKPKKIGPSPLRTIAQAIDLLARLFEREHQPHTEEGLAPLVFVVDDDIIARRTLCSALDKAQLRSISVDDPGLAFKLLEENNCDLIFSDVEMPGMSGFEFCAKVRALPKHKTTPLVFVTSMSDFESRAHSALSGGTDLIAKPFLLVELAVKALTYLLRKPDQKAAALAPSN
ncbi:MAG: Response regulator receiver protein [Verrucomicrobiales bacterium]|nr:Response regulator receiver protein [Verrucomicrobiales bacterium]